MGYFELLSYFRGQNDFQNLEGMLKSGTKFRSIYEINNSYFNFSPNSLPSVDCYIPLSYCKKGRP